VKVFELFEEHKLLDAPTMTVSQLAKKHKVSSTQIEAQIKKGMKHEKEHATDPNVAREIAMDHIKEDPCYYDKLEKALPES
jgi:hypothetical protein